MNMRMILQAAMSTPWAIEANKLVAIIQFLSLRASGVELSESEIQSRTAHQRDPAVTDSSIKVITIAGVIAPRIHMTEGLSSGGGASAERLGLDINAAVKDKSVDKILLDIDSPGGSVHGISELGDIIKQANQTKPVIAVANHLAASAAYWIGVNAGEFIVTPGGDVGSIGVISAHQDMSQSLAALGVDTTIISAGKFKAEGNPFGPLDEEAKAHLQSRVDEYYDKFVAVVAKGRGVSETQVRSGFGQGRTVGSDEALTLGMVDSVETLSQVIARHQRPQNNRFKSNKRRMQIQNAR